MEESSMSKESSVSLKIPGIQKVRTQPRSERTMVFPSVPDYRRNSYPSKNTEVSPTSTARRGVMDNLHLESQEVADEIRKKKQECRCTLQQRRIPIHLKQ